MANLQIGLTTTLSRLVPVSMVNAEPTWTGQRMLWALPDLVTGVIVRLPAAMLSAIHSREDHGELHCAGDDALRRRGVHEGAVRSSPRLPPGIGVDGPARRVERLSRLRR